MPLKHQITKHKKNNKLILVKFGVFGFGGKKHFKEDYFLTNCDP